VKRLLLLITLAVFSGCPEDQPVKPPVVTPPPAPTKPAVAVLSGLKGKVTLTRDGKASPAAGGPVHEGDVLETGADGHALLSAQGREVELLENSRFRVGASLAQLDLSLGELRFEETDGGEFTTSSGSGRAGAGSKVKLQAGDGGTTFEVGFGTVEFEVEDGGSNTVKAGQKFVVGIGVVEFEDTPTPEQPPVAPKPKVKLTPKGTVMLKPKSGPNAKLGADGKELDELGTFTVDKNGGLRAEMDGTTVEFEGASKGSVEPSSTDPKLGVTLGSGNARVFLKKGESVLLGGKKPLTVKATMGSTLLVTATKDGPKVEVLGGETEASVAGAPAKKLEAADVVTAKGKGLETSRRGNPIITLPANKNTRVYWGKAGDVALQFPEGDGVREVSNDPQFQSLLVSAEGSDLVVVPAPLKGSLYWRRKGDQESSGARFERDENATSMTAKSDTVAETGLKATVYFQSAVPTLTFTFPLKEGASSWRFRVYSVNDLKTPMVDRRVNENRTVVESGALKEGSYVWSAVPQDKSGVEAPGGRMNKMDIVFDNSVTRLVLTSPRDGERASTATGVAPLGSRLSLNGKSVPLDGAGRFSVALSGSPILVFKLVTKEGAESQWVRRVSR
jgi:hypothetical protein